MKVGHVSATSISSFKACPTRYRIGYVEGIREISEPEARRMGIAWHKGLEVLEAPVGTHLRSDGVHFDLDADNQPIAVTDENRLELAVAAATNVYTTVPEWADATTWAVEREIIANALAVYAWLYPADKAEYETVATELPFDLPLVNPETNHATPTFRRVGKIDRTVRHKGDRRLLVQENKSTSRPIDSGSTYWARLRKDTQSKFYILAARDLQNEGGALSPLSRDFDRTAPTISGLLHDVFHKPAIKPSKLTQAETKAFIETGEYCGQKFNVDGSKGPLCYEIDNVPVEIELGAEPKKAGAPRPFAIRETPGMFGARLFQAMIAEPEKYFARREIAFTDDELLDFRYQVWNLQKTMAEMERTGHYYENEQQCEAVGSFKCPYTPICYNNIRCFDGVTVPPGFKRIRQEEAEQTEAATTE